MLFSNIIKQLIFLTQFALKRCQVLIKCSLRFIEKAFDELVLFSIQGTDALLSIFQVIKRPERDPLSENSWEEVEQEI